MTSNMYRSILLVLTLYFKPSYANNSNKWSLYDRRVQLRDNSPTTLGGTTTFFAQALSCVGQRFRFCFTSEFGKSCGDVNSRFYNYSISNWKSSGKHKVSLTVERTKPNYTDCGQASIYAVITDTITARLKTTPSENPLYTGPVLLTVLIHDPSHMFDTPRYNWDFGDGSYMNNSHIGEITHNFTEKNTHHVKVMIFAMAKGKLYNGTVKRDLIFEVNFDSSLTVINPNNISTLTLPSNDTQTAYVAIGRQVELIVKYNNPYSIVQNCHCQWNIAVTGNACSTKYTFTKEKTYVYVTPTFETRQGNETEPFRKKVIAEEPISGLTIENSNSTSVGKSLEANISCHGNPPFKMCWKWSRYSSLTLGDEPFFDNCTGLSETCRFHINHTITQNGMFKLDVSVINRVGSAHLVEHFSLPMIKPVPHHHEVKTEAISAVIPIIICIILVIILVFLARKVYTIRHRSVLETANFDFRDEDCRSVDSLNLGNKWCPSVRFKFWKRFSKNREDFPLMENNYWGSGSSSSLYSDVL